MVLFLQFKALEMKNVTLLRKTIVMTSPMEILRKRIYAK